MDTSTETATVIRYVDPVEGFRGWLAYSGVDYRLAAGGFRVQLGVDEGTVVQLAQAMSLKERLLGLSVDGAKAAIDYDPRAPGKHEAMRRFIRFLRPCLLERFSMGPDMGTTWSEIEGIARAEGMVSVKAAVATAQGLEESDFLARVRLLDVDVGGLTLGERRAGHAVAHAALAATERLGPSRRCLRIGIQGFGTLGRAAALSLAEAGVIVGAVADEHGCLLSRDGLDVAALLASPLGWPTVETHLAGSQLGAPEEIFAAPLDVIVLAACENAVSANTAATLAARAVVVGANLGLGPGIEAQLHNRGVAVVPDFVGGCGGSASMEALFGPPRCPSPVEVLAGAATTIETLVRSILDRSRCHDILPREAALALCEERPPPGKPYGRWAGKPVEATPQWST